MENLRLGMIMGAGPSLKRSRTLVPPQSLRDGSVEDLPQYVDQVVDIVESDVRTHLGHELTKPTTAALEGIASLLLRAARKDAVATRALARLYSAGIRPDPAFTDGSVKEHPDALSGMGLEQWLPAWARRVHDEGADALDQFAFIHAVLEGRVRPLLLALPVLADIAGGSLRAEMGSEGLGPVHLAIQTAYYRPDNDHHYVDHDGNPMPREVWKLRDFEHARKQLRHLTKDSRLDTQEQDGFQALRDYLHQNPLHPSLRDKGSRGGVNYNEVRHAVAHLSLSLTSGHIHLGRGLWMAEWLNGAKEVQLQAFSVKTRVEVVKEAWDLFALSWACELAANVVDWWLSATILKEIPYPWPGNLHAVKRDEGYEGLATLMLAAMASSMAAD